MYISVCFQLICLIECIGYMYMYKYSINVRMYGYTCMYYISMCVCVRMHICVRVSLCIQLRVAVFQIRSCDLNSIMGGSDQWLLQTRYNSDSKIDPWVNPKICTGSYSEDQTAIRFQNYAISCECLLLCHFFIYHCQQCVCVCVCMLLVLFHVIIWYILLV